MRRELYDAPRSIVLYVSYARISINVGFEKKIIRISVFGFLSLNP